MYLSIYIQMRGILAINNPDELSVVIALSCKNQIQMPYAPKFKNLQMLLLGSVSLVMADELNDRWPELGIVTEPR